MTKVYRLDTGQRAANAVFGWLTRAGLGARYRYILTTSGRVSGAAHSTPVDVIEVGGHRWLVAAYGVTNWVRNVRVQPEMTLRRGRRTELAVAEAATADEAVPVVRAYLRQVPVTRPYWNVTEHSSDAEIRATAAAHPVFRVRLRTAHPSGGVLQ